MTKSMNKFAIPLLVSAALAISACADTTETDTTDDTVIADGMATDTAMETGTIVDVASDNANFSTLVSAVTAADLGDTLGGPGPYTIFAPTNDAFAKVDEATMTDLMKPENKEKLSSILAYHVVSGDMDAAALTKAITDAGGTYEITTVNGAKLTAMVDGGAVKLTDANGGVSTVTMTDVDGSNGTIHAIDTVLMPS